MMPSTTQQVPTIDATWASSSPGLNRGPRAVSLTSVRNTSSASVRRSRVVVRHGVGADLDAGQRIA